MLADGRSVSNHEVVRKNGTSAKHKTTRFGALGRPRDACAFQSARGNLRDFFV
jgi:hypothetical protein